MSLNPDLTKSVSGNREMHEALGLDPCLDPLHSSGLRKFASERDALCEEVSLPTFPVRRGRDGCVEGAAGRAAPGP